MTIAPHIDPRAAALSLGETRRLRAAWKRDADAQAAAELIACPPAWADRMTVRAVLRAVPWVWNVKADAMLERVGLGPADLVGHITWDQRRELVARLHAIAQGIDRPGAVCTSWKRWAA